MPCRFAAADTFTLTTTTTDDVARIWIDYINTAGPGSLKVTWAGPGITGTVAIPGSALSPDYGLVTSTTTMTPCPRSAV